MDIENHPKMMALELKDAPPTKPVTDMHLTKVSDSGMIQVVETPTYGTPLSTILQGDVNTPTLFATVEPIYGDIDITDVGAAGDDNIFFYGPFIQDLVKSFIGSDMVIPVPTDGGYGELLGDIFSNLKERDGGYGSNSVSSEEITHMLKSFCTYNLIAGEDGGMLLKTDILYLPIYTKDLYGSGNMFDKLPMAMRAVVRAVLDGVSFDTFIRIKLKDTTELTLWYSPDNLIIMG